MNFLHGLLVVCDFIVGRPEILMWNTAVTMIKKAKKMSWMPRPSRMTLLPVLRDDSESAVASKPPPMSLSDHPAVPNIDN